MFLTLYDQHNNQKMEMAPSDSSTQQKAIQSDNVLSLSFVTYECQTLEVNDYIDFYGERFWITSKYTPKQKSTVEWEYDVKLYGIESLIKRYLVVKLVNGSNETEFAYTATAYDQVALIVQNINAGMGTTDWKVGEVVISEYLVIDYEGIYCDEALKKVAELTGVEYWIDGTTVNVTRCEHGELIPLGYDNGLTSLYTDKADNIKFFTRLFPIGSTRNISYEDYGRSRLQLPNGIDYIDQDVDKFGVIHHFEKNAFADIYPRRIGVISSVRSQEVKGENGKPFTIYYIKDDSLNFNPNDYEIEGLVKIVSFQENSSLAGRDFEVNYNATTKEFEIITQWPYDNDIQLPNAQLPPKVLDEYILWNIKMPNEYYPLAEAEYKKAVDKYMEDKRKDISVYKAHTDYIDIAERELNLTIGQRVRLEHSKYFAEGYRNSRITRITRKVLRPTDMDIEISDVLSKGALDKVNDDISDVNHYTKVALGGLPEIIKSWEATPPTDTNVFSSRKVLKECLSRTNDDTAEGSIRFTKGVRIGGLDAKYAIDEQGKATLAQIHSPNHDGIDRKGYVLEEIENTGQYVIRIHSAEIFGELMVNMLTVSEQRAVIGAEVNTCAGCEISMVEELEDRYRCYYQSKFGQWWMVGDQPECKRMISGGKVSNYYWRLVVAVGSEQIEGEQYFWFDLSKSVALGSGVPAKGDQVANCGHRGSDARRKNYIITSAWGESPYTAIYKGIDDFSIEGKRVKYESAELVEIVSDVFRLTSPDGRTVTPPVQVRADGVWSAQRVPYYYYQQVMHKGFAWLCIDKSTTGTGVEPSPSTHSSWICTSKDYDGELADVKELIDGVAAESSANAQRLVAMSSDGILSREEKVTARSMWQQIQLSYTKLVGLATANSVSYAALTAARNALEALFVTVWLNSDTDWVYPATGQAGSRMDYDSKLSNWEFEISKLSDAISKGRVDAIEIGGVNLVNNSKIVQGATNEIGYYYFSDKIYTPNTLKKGQTYICGATTTSADGTLTLLPSHQVVLFGRPFLCSEDVASIAGYSGVGMPYVIEDFKIFKGNKDLGWQPSIADVKSDYTLVADNLATTKSALAEAAANAKTDAAKKALEGQISELDKAKANLDSVYAKALVDGKITQSEQSAIDLANRYTLAQRVLAESTSAAYADGVVTAEEQRAIADATAKAEEARVAAINAAKDMVDYIQIGGGNLLANSRFDDPALFGVNEGVASLVNDPKFGRVVQWQRTIGSGNFQTNHSINTKILVGREVTFSVIAKNIESGAWSFGGWGATVNALRSTSTQVPLGDGWYLYHSTFIHPAETATFGLNSITGTWQFYAAMVTLGNKPLVDWSPSTEDTQGQIANAQNAADNAIEDITTQGTRIDSWASDFVVSPPEKMSLKDQHNAAIQEKISIDADAAKYGLTATTAYTQYVSGASAAFATWNKYTQSIPENITIGADYGNIAAYYKFRSSILTAISDKVSKDYSDNIQIGGVNLILKSIVSTASPAGYAGFIGWWTLRQLLVPGKTYVFSTNIKPAEISTIAVAPTLGSGTGQQVIVPNVPFVANALHRTVYMTGNNANNIGYVVQLEDGNKVTPWSSCPDDLKAEIDDTKTIFSSQIASLDSKIALKVSQTDFNSLGSRVSVAESSITVNSNNIALKVSKDGIISSINQTPEAVKISADRIILDGNTIARIIESEHITTSRLTVTSGAKIGGFKINGSGLSNESSRDEGFIEYNYTPANCYAGIGSNVFEPVYGLRAMGRFSNGEYNPYDANFGIVLDVWNGEANKNHAIYIRRGMITGANYPTLRTEEAFPLTIEHEYIACYNSSNISFTLPSPTVAHKGKRYQFKRCKGGRVTVHGTIFKNDVATNTPVGAGVGDVATFQNDGMYWCYSFQGC